MDDVLRRSGAGAALEALLLQQCLQPLAGDRDAIASFALGDVARSIAERDAGGFGAILARQLGNVR